jgi:hypothetical protein
LQPYLIYSPLLILIAFLQYTLSLTCVPLPLLKARISAIFDKNVLASDVVMLDKASPPADRGPTLAEAQKLMKTWQFQVSGKLAVAAALTELPVDHIKHGEH